MEINIKFMSEEAYKTLQKNYKEVYQMILDHPSDCSWLKEYLGFEPFEEKKYVIEDFELLNTQNYHDVAFQNGVILYEKLCKLPRYILCNNRFWAWVTFEKTYKQAINSIKLSGPQIIKNWWVPGTSRRDLMLGVVSRGFFRTEISIDETRQDKYELTKYILANSESYRNLTFRNIGMLKNVSLAYLSVELDITNKYKKPIPRVAHRELMKEASRIGSVMLIDVMSQKEIYDRLYEWLDDFMNNYSGNPDEGEDE